MNTSPFVPSCREALKEYQAVIDQVIPALAPEELSEKIDPGPGWSQNRSEQILFDRIAGKRKREQGAGQNTRSELSAFHTVPHPFQFSDAGLWRRLSGLYAAAILLFVALGWLRIRLAHGERFPRPSPCVCP